MIDVVVSISGGAVQGVAVSDGADVNVIVVDFDNLHDGVELDAGSGPTEEEWRAAQREMVGPYPTEPLSSWPDSDDPDDAMLWARPHLTPPLAVAAVISAGEMAPEVGDTATEVLDKACEPLDRACAPDILGPVLFLTTDGRFHGVWTEAVIGEASQDFVRSCVDEVFDAREKDAVFVRPGAANDETGYGYRVAGSDSLAAVRLEPDGRVVVVPTPCVLTRQQFEAQIGTWCHPGG